MARAKKSMLTRRSTASQSELIPDAIPRSGTWPDEDPDALRALREAFSLDLNPGTAYERSLVEQIVALEWESHRARRMRDASLLASVERSAYAVLANSGIEWEDRDAPALIAGDLVGEDLDARKIAVVELSDLGVSVTELTTIAYQEKADDIQFFDARIGELERRKRRLREDFDKLKMARIGRSRAVVDAETME